MIVVIFGIYTLFLALIWGFFVVAKIHAYKFKDFSPNIEKVTKILAIVLFIISILGYIVVYNFKGSFYTVKIEDTNANTVTQENY
ncbi:MAG: hypothetical protein PHR68_03420 [Candidatus Gracilibacteria bacterium]|nr:hypothetical protein [Candidatus Gracilibacteria bacterium]